MTAFLPRYQVAAAVLAAEEVAAALQASVSEASRRVSELEASRSEAEGLRAELAETQRRSEELSHQLVGGGYWRLLCSFVLLVLTQFFNIMCFSII